MERKPALLGLGAMGRAMLDRLGNLGVEVSAWNRSPRPEALARSVAEAVGGADTVILMLSDGAATAAVVADAVPHVARGTLFVDMSTSGPASARALEATLMGHGMRFVDAPVSGTVGPARRGELVAFVGGHEQDVERARPVLELLCRRVLRAGTVGQGQALKVVVNGLGAHHLVAFASMLALGERAGLARDTLVEAFTSGAFASPSYVGKKARVLAHDYAHPDFTLRLTKKDVDLALALAREQKLAVPVLERIGEEVTRAVDAGLGDEDLFAMEKAYPRR